MEYICRASAYNNRQTPSTAGAKRQVLLVFAHYGRKCFKLTLFLLQQTLDSDWSVELQVYYINVDVYAERYAMCPRYEPVVMPLLEDCLLDRHYSRVDEPIETSAEAIAIDVQVELVVIRVGQLVFALFRHVEHLSFDFTSGRVTLDDAGNACFKKRCDVGHVGSFRKPAPVPSGRRLKQGNLLFRAAMGEKVHSLAMKVSPVLECGMSTGS
jgi:hypothetical protein